MKTRLAIVLAHLLEPSVKTNDNKLVALVRYLKCKYTVLELKAQIELNKAVQA